MHKKGKLLPLDKMREIHLRLQCHKSTYENEDQALAKYLAAVRDGACDQPDKPNGQNFKNCALSLNLLTGSDNNTLVPLVRNLTSFLMTSSLLNSISLLGLK